MIATALVVAVAAIVARLPSASRPERASTYASSARATPGIGQHDEAHATALPVTGDAPWALSALPECFRQLREVSGTSAYVRARTPQDVRRLDPGTTIAVADCRLLVGANDATVTRGENLLRIPGARLFVRGDRLVLVTREDARLTLRMYRLAGP